MKKSIACKDCINVIERAIATYATPGEFYRIKTGEAASQTICYRCHEVLLRGDIVSCVTRWSMHGQPYEAWEDEVIDIKEVIDEKDNDIRK